MVSKADRSILVRRASTNLVGYPPGVIIGDTKVTLQDLKRCHRRRTNSRTWFPAGQARARWDH